MLGELEVCRDYLVTLLDVRLLIILMVLLELVVDVWLLKVLHLMITTG